MDAIELIKKRCMEKHITVAKLERDLDFSNGYIGKLKNGNIPIDRAKAIANYLNISLEKLLGIEEDLEIVQDSEMNGLLRDVMDFSGCDKEDIFDDKRVKRLLMYYMLMTREQRSFIDTYVDVFAQQEEDRVNGTN